MDQEIANQDRIFLELTRNNPPWGILIITSALPSLAMIVLVLAQVIDVFFIYSCVLFLFVGFLNYYVFESRDIPLKLKMTTEGIWFLEKKGQVRQYTWAEIKKIKEITKGLRGKQRLEVYFSDGMEPLKLYAFAMHLPDRAFGDQLSATGQAWDRPVKLSRTVLEKYATNLTKGI
ncbi:hypothetical protein N9F34_05220 [Alphaproteobacteria bacterium]|nr:hypothetical protein [Alphaproteobacteria bacterium]